MLPLLRKPLSLSLALLVLVLLAACESEPLPTPIPTNTAIPPTATATHTSTPTATFTPSATPTATLPVPRTDAFSADEQAFLRVVHANPDIDAVDVFVDGLRLASGVRYGQFTGQAGIVTGEYTVRVVTDGGNPLDDAIVQNTALVLGGQSLILLFAGNAEAPVLQTVAEDIAPLEAERSRLVLVNALSGDTSIGVDVAEGALIPPLSAGAISRPSLLESERRDLSLQSGGVVLSDYNINLRPRESYTLILAGRAPDFNVIQVSTRVEGLATVRVVNAAVPGPEFDIYLGEQQLGQGIAYGAETEARQVRSGEYRLTAYRAGEDPAANDPFLEVLTNANAGENLTLLMYGISIDELAALPIREDLSELDPGTTRLIVANIAPEISSLTYKLSEQAQSSILEEDRLFAEQAARPITLPAGGYSVEWLENDSNVLLNSGPYRLEAGRTYLLAFSNFENAEPVLLARDAAVSDQPQPIETLQPQQIRQPTRLRVVNAAPGIVPEFRLDDLIAFQSVGYGTGSGLLIIAGGERVLTARDVARNRLLAREVVTFEDGQTYSAFLYGTPEAGFGLLIVSDADVQTDDNNPTIRLINLSQDRVRLSVALGPPPIERDETPTPVGLPAEDAEAAGAFGPPTLPGGLRRYQRNIEALAASETVITLRETGLRSAYIVEATQRGVVAVLPGRELQAEVHYDIIAYQVPDRLTVDGFIIAYPMP